VSFGLSLLVLIHLMSNWIKPHASKIDSNMRRVWSSKGRRVVDLQISVLTQFWLSFCDFCLIKKETVRDLVAISRRPRFSAPKRRSDVWCAEQKTREANTGLRDGWYGWS
jgi:hypothetical protein